METIILKINPEWDCTVKKTALKSFALRIQILIMGTAMSWYQDLSASFNVANINLLIKCLKIIGIPYNFLSSIEILLGNRMVYAEIMLK